jgi:hypothetical protein
MIDNRWERLARKRNHDRSPRLRHRQRPRPIHQFRRDRTPHHIRIDVGRLAYPAHFAVNTFVGRGQPNPARDRV